MNIWLKIKTIEEIKYYLYRHIRLDKYQPFYIGIGTIYKKDKNSIKLAAKCINIPYTTLIQYLKGKNSNKTTLILLKDFQKWQK